MVYAHIQKFSAHMYTSSLSHISAQKADAEYWENPQMFLSSGPHGPYYKLHSFKATDCLDTKNVRDLRIAGTLKYEVRYTLGALQRKSRHPWKKRWTLHAG